MRQILLLILNSITLILVLTINYLIGSGSIGAAIVGEISAKYESLFTPAGYAFAIWGLIYLLLILFSGYQWYAWIKNKNDEYLKRTGIWFILSNLANSGWIIAWTNDLIALSFFLILILLFSLIMLMFRLRLETWDAPVRIIVFVWWPICIYLGWIVVATLANLAAFSVSINPEGSFAQSPLWVIMMIAFACLVYLLLIYFRNMREAAFVGIWALAAIAAAQWKVTQSVAYAAVIASLVLFISASLQASKNLETLPHKKIKRGEI
jgi:hypothetical protein